MAGNLERDFQGVPGFEGPLARYRHRNPSKTSKTREIVIIDVHNVIDPESPSVERIIPGKSHKQGKGK